MGTLNSWNPLGHSRPIMGLFFSVKATRCTNVSNLFYFEMTLYMFRTVFPSIIRSSRLYIQQQAYVKQLLLSACWQEDSSNFKSIIIIIIQRRGGSKETGYSG